MWFRVELNKDGSVASCTEAGPSFPEKGGGRIYYIEADTKESALATGLRRYKEYLESQRVAASERRKKLREHGLCRDCRNPLDPGAARSGRRARCAECARRAFEQRYRGAPVGTRGVPRPDTITKQRAEYRAEVFREVAAAAQRMSLKRFRAWITEQLAIAEAAAGALGKAAE